MKIVIGKEPKGKHIIKVPFKFEMVSRNHAEVERNDRGEIIIKDFSTNGTFVNDEKIKKTILYPDDKVVLGDLENGYRLSLSEIYRIFNQELLAEKKNFETEFLKLKPIYEKYLKERDAIIKKSKLSAVAPRIIITIIGIIIIWFLNIPQDKKIIFTMGIGVVAMALSSVMVKDSKNRKKLDDLTIKYNKKYVCPKCKRKLNIHSRSWNMLYDDGKCPYQKCDAIYNSEFVN